MKRLQSKPERLQSKPERIQSKPERIQSKPEKASISTRKGVNLNQKLLYKPGRIDLHVAEIKVPPIVLNRV